MIASWMLYCALCALGLALAAALAERALLAGHRAVRHVWVGAMVLSCVVPAVAWRVAPRSAPADESAASIDQESIADSIAGVARSAVSSSAKSPHAPRTSAAVPHRSWQAIAAEADQPLALLWMLLSMALSGYFLAGMMALAWLRRSWKPEVVLGVPVLVSEHTGPALLTGLSPAIVVPRWALAMESSRLALMLRHEQEHQRVRDGQLLFAAQFALIAMPWNAALWWQINRLRVAVELDCDARVLCDTDPRTYGDLLLEVVRPGRRSRFMVATAFAERATQLERRIRVMTRRRERASRGARVLAASIVLAAVTAAWISPRPPGPPRARDAVIPSLASADTAVPAPLTPPPNDRHAASPTTTTAAIARMQSSPATKKFAAALSTVPRDTPPPPRPDTNPEAGRGGRGGGRGGSLRDPAEVAESVFRRLFEGIALTADQATAARVLLMQLARDDRAQTDTLLPALVEFTTRRLAIQARRDTALASILTNDADRLTLRARLTNPLGGGRRGGAGVPDSVGSQPGVGRSGGVGRGGRGSVPGPVVLEVLLPQMVDNTFHRLFDGVTLTPDQETAARAILRATQTELNAVRPPGPRPAILRELPANAARGDSGAVVLIGEQGQSSLLALVGNDADRAKVAGRMAQTNRPPLPRPPQ